MKKILTAVSVAAFLAASAAPVMIADFENGKIDGTQGYQDKESAAPVLSIDGDGAISGEYALKVVFNGCKSYQGIHFHKAPLLPEKAVAVSFLIKPLSGPPPMTFALGELEKRYGKAVATGTAPLKPVGSDWQKMTVRFDSMKYGSGPKRGEKFPSRAGAVYVITFYGPVTDQPSVFLIDDLAWETE